MARRRRTSPPPRFCRAQVVRTAQLSPHWQRVTVAGDELAGFPHLGFDQWFRLFVPHPHQDALRLPKLAGAHWWLPYLAMPEAQRPHCANYTVAHHRPEANELDVDVVLHRMADGELEGRVARWACAARPGDPLAVLDQGRIFDPPADSGPLLLVADETGLPGVAGILRSLPADTVGRVLQEVPTAEDRRELSRPAGVDVTWVVRDDADAVPGLAALQELRRCPATDPTGYGYVVGESSLATEGRRLLRRWGLPKDRITFSGYWKHPAATRAAADQVASA